MRAARITLLSLGLSALAFSSCNALTGIYDLPGGLGLGGDNVSDDNAGGAQDGGRGPVAAGGRTGTGGAEKAGGANAAGGKSDGASDGGRGPGSLGGGQPGAGGASGTGGGGQGGTGGSRVMGDGGTGGVVTSGGTTSGGGAGGTVGGATSEISLPLLDDFSSPLDTGRWVQTFDFEVSSGTVSCSYCGDALLWNEVFALPQAASVRLVSFSEHAAETNVVLVASSNQCDLIEVLYSPASGALSILSCQTGSWAIHETRPLLVGSGSVLEGRVRLASEGGGVAVQALVNGQLALEAEFEFVNAMGYIGLSGVCSGEECQDPTVFDDFRGGAIE